MRVAHAVIAIGVGSMSVGAWCKCEAIGKHDPRVLKYICEAERDWAESVASGDTRTVKRILAEDFIGVDPKGPLYRKQEMVADTAKAPEYFASNRINDVIVRFYGDMAVAQGSETWHRKKGEPVDGRFVWTDTWLKRNGNWQIVAAEDLIAPVK
jgi:ketosteroid isomerase-like protein